MRPNHLASLASSMVGLSECHECANSATPWRTVKPFADNYLMGLSAKPPPVTLFGRRLQIPGNLPAPKRYAFL